VQEWPRDVVPACEDELVAEQRYVDVRVRGHDVRTVGQEGLGSARGPRAGLLDWCCAMPAQYGCECVRGRHGLGLDGCHGVCVLSYTRCEVVLCIAACLILKDLVGSKSKT
jgi:hypothetical protein